MTKGRLEAFTDGVIAILITIMVLDLKVPEGSGWHSLRPAIAVLLKYALSYVFLGIYWNNHHHMFHLVSRVTGGMLWANLHLLFWLSLVPFVTSWMAEHPEDPLPTALYGVVLPAPLRLRLRSVTVISLSLTLHAPLRETSRFFDSRPFTVDSPALEKFRADRSLTVMVMTTIFVGLTCLPSFDW